jgi:tRNA A-37 threonylcarbamoyl transferase component Bud32
MKVISKHKEFISIDYTHNEPFIFSIQGKLVTCQKLLRLVPGRRLVFSGQWMRHNVVIKIFLTDGKGRSVTRESQGFALLKEHGFLAPELLYAGAADVDQVNVVITEALDVTDDISSFSEQRANKLLEAIQKKIIKLHAHNIVQEDLHLDNFLVVDKAIYLIDTAQIKKETDKTAQLNNLALFYAQFPLDRDELIDAMFTDYCQKRHWSQNKVLDDQLNAMIEARRAVRIESYMKKTFRRSTEFAVLSRYNLKGVYRRCLASESMRSLMRKPERFMRHNPTEILKKGNTCSVFKVQVDHEWVVVKRFNLKGVLHYMLHCWQTSRAAKNWAYSNVLRLFGVPTPGAIGYAEKQMLGLNGRAYFFMQYEPGKMLLDYLEEGGIDEAVIDQAAAIFSDFKKLQLTHGDTKATNYLVNDDKVSVIDLDSMRWFKNKDKWEKARAKDIARFRKNWLRSPRLLKAFDLALGRVRG